jgi:methionyl-tRNA formyltransferase
VTDFIPSHLVLCGKGRIAASALSWAVHHVATQGLPTQVLACPNGDDRGYDTWQASLVRAADQLGVRRVRLADVEPEPSLVLISLEYDRIIRVARFASGRLFNIHFSALPAYRGVYTSIWPLLRGEREAGVTLHYMDPGVDTGAVVSQRRFAVPGYLTARQLYELFSDEGLALFREWLPVLLRTVPDGTPQSEEGASSFNRDSLDLRQREIDLAQSAERVCAFVRAYTFPEYQLPTLDGRAVRACAELPGRTDAAPATRLHDTPFSTSVATGGGGIIELTWG